MLRSSGTCAVRGCTYNQTKLNNWLKLECFDHKPVRDGTVSIASQMNDEAKRNLLKNLNLKKPPKKFYVCSFHFVGKKPMQDNPYPMLILGKRPPEKRLRLSRRVDRHGTTTDEPGVMEVSEEPGPISKTFHDAQTKWSDHTLPKAPIITCGMMTAPAPERSLYVADVALKNDAAYLLYTGIPLLNSTLL
ncbi:hypothetical protein N1851_032978 [Merluccius polli]|uniref:THAP-type domain-containing protein n=1 Tax=Merluccius polli TaxID=89951 RepID=A0AA47M2B2_MERPO|nr:hypothetical protein N1851_032978 [Merluccius polli]